MPLLSASIVSAPVATSETYVDIPGLYIDIAKAEIRDGKLQVILNVPTPYATGNNFPGIYFAIATDKGVVADGCFTYSSKVPEATGRMPFTLVATIDVGTGVTFVKGQWKSVRGSAMHIDSYASLSAIGGTAAQSSSQGSGSGSGETGAGGNTGSTGGTGSGTIGGGGERDGTFNLPPNIKFGVTALTNAANDQTIDIYVDDNPKPVATFKGAGVQDQNLGTKVLDSGKGRVRVIVMANGKPSRLGSRQVDLFKKSYFGIVGSEDGSDDDYNDGIVFLNWPLG
ncbi:fucose-binding lectin II [Burkholderia contaminans]|uniref:fucose-binding lectin II n=1 Tax=Burkholderia contaminans TaxID=488447 RepID=UPI000F5B4A0E|nr:fucose-binding lectin II [Burkholderia contaminans]MCA7882423.1 fucose-binding lectin II [Burkholderia contaminans]MCA8154106.1 fucose-binding lectin II [Burkholderia contaminans]RQT10162.1 fucose-binding lectin II [Burkholderia contaminans]VWC94512.1 photopexin A [Burkholderia contaminans]HEM7876270.1 fucose-binding lectin II [Burkholderia contaminans]